jgi:TDG/mug DNA glycosylase family protein
MRYTKSQLLQYTDQKVPDIISYNLRVLFCGINPGLYSAATRMHFARPGNRFWKALFLSGFTNRLYHPSEGRLLLNEAIGITNVVERATAGERDIIRKEFVNGKYVLEKKIKKYHPFCVAFLGIGAYRDCFQLSHRSVGLQKEKLGKSFIWVLPNPSGLNVHFQLNDFVVLFRKLKMFAEPRDTT